MGDIVNVDRLETELEIYVTLIDAMATVTIPGLAVLTIPVTHGLKGIILSFYRKEIESEKIKKDREKLFIAFEEYILKNNNELNKNEAKQYIYKSYEIITHLSKDYDNIIEQKEAEEDIKQCIEGMKKDIDNIDQTILYDIVWFFVVLYMFVRSPKVNKDIHIVGKFGELEKRLMISEGKFDEIEKKQQETERRVESLEEESKEYEKRFKKLEEEKSQDKENNKKSVIEKELKSFANNYINSLYLHPGTEVNLKNLFIPPYIKKLGYRESINIIDFFKKYSLIVTPLFILGDGGSGKTSFVSWLVWNYLNNKEEDDIKEIFTDRKLIVVKLRELDKKLIEKKGLYDCICKYLEIENDVEQNNSYFIDKYVILDGLDELYYSTDVENWGNKISALFKSSISKAKLVITSRASISLDGLACTKYEIQKYNETQKEQWINKFEAITGEKLNNEIKEHLLKDDEVFVYPQMFYMATALKKKNTEWSLDNEWSIYHQIFHEDIYSKPYTENYEYIEEYDGNLKEILYQVIERIAYELYIQNFATLFDNKKNQLDNIIKEVCNNNDYQIKNTTIKNCVMLVCLFNNETIGGIEFLHNNIRDYFIAEYLYRQLSLLFNSEFENNINIKSIDLMIERKLYDLIRSVDLGSFNYETGEIRYNNKVLHFLQLRSRFEGQKDKTNTNSIRYILKTELIEHENIIGIKKIFRKVALDLDMYHEFKDYSNISSVLSKVANFQLNLINILNMIMDFPTTENTLKAEDPLIKGKLIEYMDSETRNIILRTIFQGCAFFGMGYPKSVPNNEIRKIVYFNKMKLSEIDLSNRCLKGIFLEGADISSSFLNNCDLSNSDLKNTNLNGTNLSNSNLSKANFQCANLSRTNLSGANLFETELFEAELINVEYDEKEIKKAYNWDKAVYNKNEEINKLIIEKIRNS